MGKYKEYKEEIEIKEVEVKAEEMSVEEAKEKRASLHKASGSNQSEQEKRESFRIFWAQEKSKYAMSADIEEIVWLHLKTMNMNSLEKFSDGIKHFGLKKLDN